MMTNVDDTRRNMTRGNICRTVDSTIRHPSPRLAIPEGTGQPGPPVLFGSAFVPVTRLLPPQAPETDSNRSNIEGEPPADSFQTDDLKGNLIASMRKCAALDSSRAQPPRLSRN
eukprot:Selendium_serpulae@DN5002_c1_g1_i1.p1